MIDIKNLAELITSDPCLTFDLQYLHRRYCDRSAAMDLHFEPLLESQIAHEFDTTGDLKHDYPVFMSSMSKNKDNKQSLTFYSLSDYAHKGATLYKLKGIDAGFAIADDGDIISVHNSEAKDSPYRGIGRHLVQLAKEMGGTKLDHFDFPKLNEIYASEGFKEYDRVPWDDNYAPEGWNYEKYGRPDLVFRKL